MAFFRNDLLGRNENVQQSMKGSSDEGWREIGKIAKTNKAVGASTQLT